MATLDKMLSHAVKVADSYTKDTHTYTLEESSKVGLKTVTINNEGVPLITITQKDLIALDGLEEAPRTSLYAFPHMVTKGWVRLFLDVVVSDSFWTASAQCFNRNVDGDWYSVTIHVCDDQSAGYVYEIALNMDNDDYLRNYEDVTEELTRFRQFYDEVKETIVGRNAIHSFDANTVIVNILTSLPPSYFIDDRVRCSVAKRNVVIIDWNTGSVTTSITLHVKDHNRDDMMPLFAKGKPEVKLPAVLRRGLRTVRRRVMEGATFSPLIEKTFNGDIVNQYDLLFGNVTLTFKTVYHD